MLAKIQKSAHFRSQLDDVTNRVKTGEALSSAFEAQTGVPVMYTTTLLAGERSGNLQEVLERYVGFQKVSLTFRKKLIASLIYPALLLTMVLGLLTFMFTVVIPQFAELYDQMGSQLPKMTLALLAFGKWTQHNFVWIAVALLVILVGRLPVLDYGKGPRRRGLDSRRCAGLWKDLAQIPGGVILANPFDTAYRRIAAGAVA